MRERFEQRWALGPLPFSGGTDARVGGWIRPVEPRPVDHLLVTMLTDAWVPSVFARLTPDDRFSVPTVDLTVHFRGPLPPPGVAEDDFLLVAFSTRVLAEGYMEEDGEVWAPDGTLLAQSRQLAAVLPVPG
jgi:acyl-CoA thioesterase